MWNGYLFNWKHWRFLSFTTPEILNVSPNLDVAIGVHAKMIRIGPIVLKKKYFSGNVYKLVQKVPELNSAAVAEQQFDWKSKMKNVDNKLYIDMLTGNTYEYEYKMKFNPHVPTYEGIKLW